jgi:protein tyrosine/serine phosphatase
VWKCSRRTCFYLLCAGALLAPLADYAWKALDNFHEVLPGEFYRSAQLSGYDLEVHARLNGLRSIINLRGPNPGQRWYREEVAAARHTGLVHIDLPIDSAFPTRGELAELAQVLETCPKPVLVHCQSGIDRTGIASALACLLLDDSASPELALKQLDWQFGSMPWRKSRAAKRDFLIAYAAWLQGRNLTHSRSHFHTWLQHFIRIDGPLA